MFTRFRARLNGLSLTYGATLGGLRPPDMVAAAASRRQVNSGQIHQLSIG